MQYRIPMYSLDRLYDSVREPLEATLLDVARSAVYTHGPRAKELEKQVAAMMGCRHAIAVRSGTSAIYLALAALGIGHGDEVITVANSDMSTTSSISQTGAQIALADIDPRTYNMDPRSAEALITSRTKALLPVHMYGRPADMEPLLALGKRHNIPVVEDACLAFAATYRGRMCGSMGIAGCHSFATRKVMGGVGAGGLVVTSDDKVAQNLRYLAGNDIHEAEGYNLILDEFQSAAVLCKLPKLSEWIKRRREIAAAYDSGLKGTPAVVPAPDDGCFTVFRNYALRVPARDAVREYMARRGIETGLHFCPPAHKRRAYKGRPLHYRSLKNTDQCSEEMLNLPVHPFLRDDEVAEIVQTLKDAMVCIT